MNYKLKKISGDASFREFYRISKNKKTSIVVYANQEKYKNLIVYSAINKILNNNNILAPKLINYFVKKNIIEITDLGKISFLDFIKNKKNKIKYYKKLIDLIIKMQKINLKENYIFDKKNIKLEKYSIKNLHKESDLFFSWYLKAILKTKKVNLIKKRFRRELSKIYNRLYFKNSCFTHRDFHSANIIVSKSKFGVIDSQDALFGNPLYDVASLIDDVRIKLNNKTQNILLDYYINKSKYKKVDKYNFKNDFDILSVQRNLKILGVFVRLLKRDKKNQYLKYLPNTWRLIDLRMKNPIFKDLRFMIDKLVDIKKLKKINSIK